MSERYEKIVRKGLIFAVSGLLALWLYQSEYVHQFIAYLLPIKLLVMILAGVLYTTFLTSPLSIAMFLVLAEQSDPVSVAVLAGLGAALGDLILVKVFREEVQHNIVVASHHPLLKPFLDLFKRFKLLRLNHLLGIFFIASPLPDEIGLSLLGASKLSYLEIAVLTFILNTIGILLIVLSFSIF